jgi:acetyl-CoA carboxylase carboxyl transferase subunit alpha
MADNILKNMTAWDKVNMARMMERPRSLTYINKIFDNFIEFHGDRFFGDDPSIIGGIGKINDIPVTIIAQQKGENTKDNLYRNFGMNNPEGYRKSMRLMKQAEKFNRPIICFVDTPAAYPGAGAEERGIGEAIARNLYEMMKLTVPIISIVIGEGGSGGALALAVANEVWMLEHSIYSILPPEGFATILWKDSTRAKEASEIMKITAQDLKEFGIIERIIEEPKGGAHTDVEKMSESIKRNIIDGLNKLRSYNKTELCNLRYEKFRKVGEFYEE